MSYWRILAGHQPEQSKILGDWLIGNFVSLYSKSITSVKNDKNAQNFRDGLQIGDKVVIYTNGCVFGMGEITGEMKSGKPPRVRNHPYSNWRKLQWIKTCKIESSRMPPSAKQKLARNPAMYIKELDREIWEVLMLLA